MKVKVLLSAMLLCCTMAHAQSDPTLMTINGTPVSRSEFEYSYNKNNSDGVIDKKTVNEYVDLFINYKLKVQAALDAHLDTLSSFKKEFLSYRNQQIRPSMITDADVEAEARKMYKQSQERIDGQGGMLRVAHILLSVKQDASAEVDKAAKLRADSIYNAIKKGADFGSLAKQFSGDPGSASKGGELPWITRGQTVKEFDNKAYSMQVGEVSEPVKSPFGYHIIKLLEKQNFFPYDSLRKDIIKFIEVRGFKEKIINEKIDSLAKANNVTKDEILDKKLVELEANDPDLSNLVREYHDGLLLFEISNREVWNKAAKDDAALVAYFKKHRKEYKWDAPRFKGIAYHVKDQADIEAVRNSIKNVPFTKWGETLRNTFNNDTVIRIRVEKGIFKQGDNSLIDKNEFGADVTVKETKGYPYDATYGKKLSQPEEMEDVRGQVTSDYQNKIEEEWVKALRKKYKVVVNRDVLATVNKH